MTFNLKHYLNFFLCCQHYWLMLTFQGSCNRNKSMIDIVLLLLLIIFIQIKKNRTLSSINVRNGWLMVDYGNIYKC